MRFCVFGLQPPVLCTVLENKVCNSLDLDACLKAKQKNQGAEACGTAELEEELRATYAYLRSNVTMVLVLKIFRRKAWS